LFSSCPEPDVTEARQIGLFITDVVGANETHLWVAGN